MSIKPVVFTATCNPEKSRSFYENVLGCKFVSDHPFAIVFDIGGITLRVQKVKEVVAVPYTTMGLEVEDILGSVNALIKKGVKFEHYPFLKPDELGIWTTPDGAKVAWCKDPDGSLISLTQNPPQ
jgi:catechol 2,3-dioxygenase-like lactoylglutathione lyase family enzyme